MKIFTNFDTELFWNIQLQNAAETKYREKY